MRGAFPGAGRVILNPPLQRLRTLSRRVKDNAPYLLALLFVTLGLAAASAAVAPKPLYRDPVYDGAADPVVVWNQQAKTWWMFYTSRRANVPGLSGVAWVHG